MLTLRLPRSAQVVEAASGTTLGGSHLSRRLAELAEDFRRLPPGAVFVGLDASLPAVLCCLGLLASGRPVLPLDPEMPESTLVDVVDRFAPVALVRPSAAGVEPGLARWPSMPGYERQRRAGWGDLLVRRSAAAPTHEDLGLLLATSGSTGAPKLVRLSTAGLLANSRAIVAALAIAPDDVALTALPLHYSYGLSVLVSHLLAGATVVCGTGNVTARHFWQSVDRWRVSTLALVPAQYEMLARMRWRAQSHPTVRVMTVAGGRLADPLTRAFHAALVERGGRFYVMYGQTEAGPRICVLPSNRLPDKLGSAGTPVSGVRLRIGADDGGRGAGPGRSGEVICSGPGVMMGYADDAAELCAPDRLHGILPTGDLGELDADGYLWLSGRTSRIGKVFGIRVHLDAVERLLSGAASVAAVGVDDGVRVWCEGVGPEQQPQLLELVASGLKVHRSGIDLRVVPRLPRLSNGKTDYRRLEQTP